MTSRLSRLVAPGGWLGLLGGGQLGRMFAMAAQSLGYRVCVLDPARGGPAASVADEHLEADYLDAPALERLALQCAAITTEFENVPAQSLAFLSEHSFTTPSAEAVAVAQDRIAEKRFVASCGIAVAPHAVIESADDLASVDASLFPAILKSSRMGYDGKGQARVATREEAVAAFASLGGRPAVLEQRLDLAFEASVIVARGHDGATAIYAPAENVHRDGILAVTTVPSPHVTPALEADLVAATLRIAHALDYVGVLCVEFFVVRDAATGGGLRVIVNELAPRPHNSGHYTINACVTSQFSQQARIVAGLPLGETRRHSAAVMLNLLGDLWFRDGGDGGDGGESPTHGPALDAKADADVEHLVADAQASVAVDRLVARAEAAVDQRLSGDRPALDADDATPADLRAVRDLIDGLDQGEVDDTSEDAGDTIDDDVDGGVNDDAATSVATEREPDAGPHTSGEGGPREVDAKDVEAMRSAAARRDAVGPREPDWSAVLFHPGVNLHLYGKREARPGRKMGHITIVAETAEAARRVALEVASRLGIDAW